MHFLVFSLNGHLQMTTLSLCFGWSFFLFFSLFTLISSSLPRYESHSAVALIQEIDTLQFAYVKLILLMLNLLMLNLLKYPLLMLN